MEEIKRKRGRPKGSKNKPKKLIKEPKRKRGRPRGKYKKKKLTGNARKAERFEEQAKDFDRRTKKKTWQTKKDKRSIESMAPT